MRAVLLLPCSRNLTCGENSHALHLENASLRESLSDGFAANANRNPLRPWRAEPEFDEGVAPPTTKPSPFGLGFVVGGATRNRTGDRRKVSSSVITAIKCT